MAAIECSINQTGIALIELNRPDKLNPLSIPLVSELHERLNELAVDDSVKAVILTGRGKAFCAGLDLQDAIQRAGDDKQLASWVADNMREHFNPLGSAIFHFPKPVVSAINGLAAGGGAGLALCADIVIASGSAALRFVQVPNLGIAADLGANWTLSRVVGRARALSACLLGEKLEADTLAEWGLVTKIVEEKDLMDKAYEAANSLASVSRDAVLATRELIDGAGQTSFKQSLEDERQKQIDLCGKPHFANGIDRFLNQRTLK